MDHPAISEKTYVIISKTEKPPNLILGKDLGRVCSAELNVSYCVVRVYDKDKKISVWHENIFQKNPKISLESVDKYCIMKAQENKRQQEDKKMITINNRNELENFLYGADSTMPETLVGIARIGGELLAEALNDEYDSGRFHIGDFFPMGDEGEGITVDRDGNILSDYLYY
jgi:hypothetical protein